MILASPPKEYSPSDQAQMRDAMRRADGENHKRGRDVELAASRLIVTDEVTGVRYRLKMASGVASWVAV
jgi:hypothetical protein